MNTRSRTRTKSASGAFVTRKRPAVQVAATLEVIDLTVSPPLEQPYHAAPSSKKRRIEPAPYHIPIAPTAIIPIAPAALAATVFQPPPPVPLATPSKHAHPPCDDKEGHYIVVVNDELGQRYRIVRLLGQGTFGKVVQAYDKALEKYVAIKIIRAVQKYRDASRVEIRVLETLKHRDRDNKKRCIHLVTHFDHKNHVCIVFELMASSIYDFLKSNSFCPFPLWQIQQFGRQLVEAVHFLHGNGLIHTDLKPENLMLESDKAVLQETKIKQRRKVLVSTDMKLIDFGSTIFENDYHSSVVSTRHYRAPEIILGLGWSFPCDMWSIGCILVEFFTGDALFQTHDNLEHLAMMEVVLGKMPSSIVKSIPDGGAGKAFFNRNGNLTWPVPEATKASRKYVKSLRPLASIISPCEEVVVAQFLDLVSRLLTYDQKKRITAAQALAHPFFAYQLA
ncbi:dual specificity protein kinase kns1 [Cladochytrium tenue]|nr:dual specificity protein kinase kns1 [Cladochytrium tenue]